MEVEELKGDLPAEAIESMLNRGIRKLTPPQEAAVSKGLLSGRHLVIAAPTASGKTLIAEMAMLKAIIWKNSKAVYIAPMRAIVTEKFLDMKKDYPYIEAGISIGDLSSSDESIARNDALFVSTEKLDSLMRHGAEWIRDVGVFVFDEIHMIDDVSRGPTLEILVSRLKVMNPHAQVIALSATIGNPDEIREWLEAELVLSDYRPVPLERGIILGDKILHEGKESLLSGSSKMADVRVAEDTLDKKKQLIVFYSSRRNAESGAAKLSSVTERYLAIDEKKELEDISERILKAVDRPTPQCEKLAKLVKKGAAFHHSGLVNEQRIAVEEGFRKGFIKTISATTTLGYGVNLPAHTVLVKDTTRYSGSEGMRRISVNEILQLFGRAGRPSYDSEGRALIVAKSEMEVGHIDSNYINAKPENIISKLGVLPVLRTHVLAFVASGFLGKKADILDFLSKTFYGIQYSDRIGIAEIVDEILAELEDWGFIRKTEEGYLPTRIGSRVSELYIDPVSAKWIIDTIPKIDDEISGLFMITNNIEMRPYSRVTEDAELELHKYYGMVKMHGDINSYYDPEKPFSTALMLRDWISEKSEAEIFSKYGETPGSLYTKLSNANWIAYSAMELARLMKEKQKGILELRVRLRYGIKKELLDLVRLEQVGRVRARMMYNAGIGKVSDIEKPGSAEKLERLFGKEIAGRIRSQTSERLWNRSSSADLD